MSTKLLVHNFLFIIFISDVRPPFFFGAAPIGRNKKAPAWKVIRPGLHRTVFIVASARKGGSHRCIESAF